MHSFAPQPDARFQAMEKKTRALAPISVGVKADRHDLVAIAGVATFSTTAGETIILLFGSKGSSKGLHEGCMGVWCLMSVGSRFQKKRWPGVGLRRPMVAVERFGLMAPAPLGLGEVCSRDDRRVCTLYWEATLDSEPLWHGDSRQRRGLLAAGCTRRLGQIPHDSFWDRSLQLASSPIEALNSREGYIHHTNLARLPWLTWRWRYYSSSTQVILPLAIDQTNVTFTIAQGSTLNVGQLQHSHVTLSFDGKYPAACRGLRFVSAFMMGSAAARDKADIRTPHQIR